MDVLAQIVVWLNAVANALGRLVLAPIAVLPGWLAATIVAAATGLLFLVVFKYTSHQRAIKAVRNHLKANLLALKLFKDSVPTTLRAQGRIFVGALQLLVLAVVPMLVMVVPVCLILGQLALWYQSRPLRVGEEAVITMKLNGDDDAAWPEVRLQPQGAMEVMIGPVRIFSKREICWEIKARASGYHQLRFQVVGQAFVADKELAIGDGFMRVSKQRPGWCWSDALRHPDEQPFGPDSPIQSIDIDYPRRSGWVSGTNSWVIYSFIVSMIAALCFRRWLNVNI